MFDLQICQVINRRNAFSRSADTRLVKGGVEILLKREQAVGRPILRYKTYLG